MRVFLLLGLWLLVMASESMGQTTWYVDGAATPGGSGTLTDPFGSIQQAIRAAAPGSFFGTDTVVSPVIAHSRWYLMQAEWTQSTGAVDVEWIRLEDSSTTGVDSLTVPVGWNDSPITAATFATWSSNAGQTWSCAQVWIGTDLDAWPGGAKV